MILCQTGSEWPIKAKMWIVCTPAAAFLWFHSNSVRKKMDLLLLETKKLVWSFISCLIIHRPVIWSASEGVEWKNFWKYHAKYFKITALLFLSLYIKVRPGCRSAWPTGRASVWGAPWSCPARWRATRRRSSCGPKTTATSTAAGPGSGFYSTPCALKRWRPRTPGPTSARPPTASAAWTSTTRSSSSVSTSREEEFLLSLHSSAVTPPLFHHASFYSRYLSSVASIDSVVWVARI